MNLLYYNIADFNPPNLVNSDIRIDNLNRSQFIEKLRSPSHEDGIGYIN